MRSAPRRRCATPISGTTYESRSPMTNAGSTNAPILEAHGCRRLRRQPGAARHRFRRAARRDDRPDGPQRHGQDDADPNAAWSAADTGRYACCWMATMPRGAAGIPARATRHRHRAGEPRRVRQPVGAGESAPRRACRRMDGGSRADAVPPPAGAQPSSRQSALRRRAADAGDRPCADDQSTAAHPG